MSNQLSFSTFSEDTLSGKCFANMNRADQVKFLGDSIKNHENMIEQHTIAIKSIKDQIDNLRKEEHLSNFLSYLDLSFETENMSNVFYEWCYDNISIADITLKCGSYLAKHGMHVDILTCGYLENRLLFHNNEYFHEYTSKDRHDTIEPESLYPKNIHNKDQLRNHIISLYKENELDSFDDDMMDFIIVYCFAEITRQGNYYNWELSVNEDFSRYDY
jgi:hypothetical protein